MTFLRANIKNKNKEANNNRKKKKIFPWLTPSQREPLSNLLDQGWASEQVVTFCGHTHEDMVIRSKLCRTRRMNQGW